MGDYKPEIVYENADVLRRSIPAMTQRSAQNERGARRADLVSVRDDVDLPVIAAFRLLAAKIAVRGIRFCLKDSC